MSKRGNAIPDREDVSSGSSSGFPDLVSEIRLSRSWARTLSTAVSGTTLSDCCRFVIVFWFESAPVLVMFVFMDCFVSLNRIGMKGVNIFSVDSIRLNRLLTCTEKELQRLEFRMCVCLSICLSLSLPDNNYA